MQMTERERNRQQMPETTKVLDAFVAVFGKPAYVNVHENDRVVEAGRRVDRDVPKVPGL
jgi:hypothetical protein